MMLGEKEQEVTFPTQQRLSLKQDVQSSFPEKGGGVVLALTTKVERKG